MNILTILGNIAGLFKSIIGYFRDKRLKDAGRDEAILQGKEKQDAIVRNIAAKRRDNSVRERTKSKYTRH
jgi:hypothetical protein